jgi:hypothetical protein
MAPQAVVLGAGSRLELVTTGQTFKVLGLPTPQDQVEVLDGRTRRYLPAGLLREAYAVGLLVPQEKD